MKKNIFKILLIFIVFLSTIIFIFVYLNKNLYFSRAFQDYVDFYLEAQSVNVSQEGVVQVNVFMETRANSKISGATVVLKYPHNILDYYFNLPEGQTGGKCSYSNPSLKKRPKEYVRKLDNENSIVYVSRVSHLEEEKLPSGLFCFGTIVFKPKTSGQGKIALFDDFNLLNIKKPIWGSHWEVVGPPDKIYTVRINQNKKDLYFNIYSNLNITQTPTITRTQTPTITRTQTPTITRTQTPTITRTPTRSTTIIPTSQITSSFNNTNLNLKIRLQGINNEPINMFKSIKIKATIKQEGGNQTYESEGVFNYENGFIWSGKISFNIRDRSGNWIVYLKGPKHIQRKICDPEPKEDNPGFYKCSQGKIVLSGSENNLDFSKITLFAGDVDQNGVTDSFDYSAVRNNLGKKDEDTIKKYDLNFDGIVNTQDFSLIIYALSVRPDDM